MPSWRGTQLKHRENFTFTLTIIYNLRSSVVVSRLTPYAKEITGNKHYGFRCNRLTIGQIYYARQIREKNMSVMGKKSAICRFREGLRLGTEVLRMLIFSLNSV
jgi:hypothetical protein